MINTLTYCDLQKCGDDEEKRIDFIERAISDFKRSDEYKAADISMKYYKKQNPDIAAVEKVIYDMKGIAHQDLISPNAKIRCCYYPNILNEAAAHLLTNGIGFTNQANKDKLGEDFDDALKEIYIDALVCGVSYGFFDGEKVINLKFFNFVPILDDYTSNLTAGIYFTQIDKDKPLVVCLYEPDGFTEYVKESGESMKVKTPKRVYTEYSLSNRAEGKYFVQAENTSLLPIYPLYNLNKQSSIIGVRENLASLDLMASQLVNNVSQAELVYWVLKNYGGMDDVADANFIINLIKSHVIHVNSDGSAEPHQISVPFEANEAAYSRIKTIVFDNLCGVNHETLDAGNLTATAIASAYSKQRNFSAMMESNVFKFIRGILKIAGITDKEKFTVEYYETINSTEGIQNVIASAPYLSEETVTEKLAILNGVGDNIEKIKQQKAAESMDRFNGNEEEQENFINRIVNGVVDKIKSLFKTDKDNAA